MGSTVTITEIEANAREVVVGADKGLRGRTLASLVKELEGFSGELTLTSSGEVIPISLEPWRNHPPESTWLAVLIVSDMPQLSTYTLSPSRDTGEETEAVDESELIGVNLNHVSSLFGLRRR